MKMFNTPLNGSEGVELFREIIHSGKEPVVFLDYDLGDTTGFEIITQLLEIKPTAKVIMETANAKSDDTMRKCFSTGAYDYLEKPIKFEHIKKIIQVLVSESGFEDKEQEIHDIIDNLISRSNQLSLEKIIEETHLKSEEILEYLQKLESEHVIKSIGTIREVSCERCDSVDTKQNYFCPGCHNTNFQQGSLIEHFNCGNISLEQKYEDDVCPKCRKQIKALGVDYRIMKNYYICYECQDKFQQPSFDYLCLKCNNKFNFDDIKWKSSSGFVVIKI